MFAFSFSAPTFLGKPIHSTYSTCHLQYPPKRPRSIYKHTPHASSDPLPADVVIVGGGVSALATAFHLSLSGAKVRLLSTESRRPATLAAAGMLAPNAETLPSHFQQLCDFSRAEYTSFLRQLKQYAPEASKDLGFTARNDFLIPFLSHEQLPNDPNLITGTQLRLLEPQLGPEVVAVRRSLSDASVNNRALWHTLREACANLDVHMQSCSRVIRVIAGESGRKIEGVQTEDGDIISGDHYIISAGAWTNSLLPCVPVRPVKGQMISLAPVGGKNEHTNVLNHVLFSGELYIVPKKEGSEFYVGATVEDAAFSLNVTAGAISTLVQKACKLVPSFADYEIKEMWAGLRPTTPDHLPVFGLCEYDNVSVASGYYRNGILLAPAAAQIAAAVAQGKVDQLPDVLRMAVREFSCTRFFDKMENGKQVASPGVGTPVTKGVIDDQMQKIAPKTPVIERLKDYKQNKSYAMRGIVKEHEQVSGVKIYEIQEDGSNKPVYPPWWSEEQVEKAEQEYEKRVAPFKKEPIAKKEVEPVERKPSPVQKTESKGDDIFPSWWTPEQRQFAMTSMIPSMEDLHDVNGDPNVGTSFITDQLKSSSNDNVSSSASSPTASDQTNASTLPKGEEKEASFTYQKEVEKPENVDAKNDAYDDILAKRGVDIQKFMGDAMSANRAFGRKKSSLETEGSPVLSLSEEEVARFDKARDEGIKEMEEFEKCFDSNHPSAIATRLEREQLERNQRTPDANGTLQSDIPGQQAQTFDGYY